MVLIVIPDDFEYVQDAIDVVPDGELGDIYIREGEYILPINPWGTPRQNLMIALKPSLHIHGDGMNKTILKRSGAIGGNPHLDIIGTEEGVACYDVTVEDLLLDGMYGPNPPNSGGGCATLSKNLADAHKRITFRRVGAINARSGFGGRNLIGTSWNDPGIIIEDCYSENVWTNLAFINSEYVKVLRNGFRNAGGDAIFPQGTYSYLPPGDVDGSCHHWIVEDNETLNSGDTAIDITSFPNLPDEGKFCGPHTDIQCRRNHLVNGHIRVSYAQDVLIEKHTLEPGIGYKSYVDVDNGAGPIENIRIINNMITGLRKYGIGFFGGSLYAEIRGNTIVFTAPYAGQTGIQAGIRGTTIIEDNKIYNPSEDGINFGNWGMGGDIASMDIRNNTIMGFGRYGVYDDAKSQARVSVLRNQMYSLNGLWGVYTAYALNRWTIRENGLTVGALNGDEAVDAPGSLVELNTPYVSPPPPPTPSVALPVIMIGAGLTMHNPVIGIPILIAGAGIYYLQRRG